MEWVYLIGLLVALAGIATLDWRYSLAFWFDKKRTILTVLCGLAVFIVWDILGIGLGIFRHGGSQFQLPFTLFPEFPIEELFFLILLNYNTLVLYKGVQRWHSRTSR